MHEKLGSCQNNGPFLGYPKYEVPYYTGIQKGTIILTTTQSSCLNELAFLIFCPPLLPRNADVEEDCVRCALHVAM